MTSFETPEKEFFESIDKLQFTSRSVPQFKITAGPSYDATCFQWEFEGEGREVGRFRRLRKLPLAWVNV